MYVEEADIPAFCLHLLPDLKKAFQCEITDFNEQEYGLRQARCKICLLYTSERQLEGAYERFFRKFGTGEVDRELIHILVRMKLQSYMELITGGYTLERTLELAEMVGWYADGGFESLIKIINNRM